MLRRVATLGLVAAFAFSSPVIAQQTLEIPTEQFDRVREFSELPVPEIMLPDGSAEGLFRAMEDTAQLDWVGSLPDAITKELFGDSPFAGQADVVWEMRATGSWNETVSGSGKLNVIDQSQVGLETGQQFMAVLNTDARDWPFIAAVSVPHGTPQGKWFPFEYVGGTPRTGFGAATNHLFERPRRIGGATTQGMKATTFTDVSFREQSLSTEVHNGRIRVDTTNSNRLHFAATVIEFRSTEDIIHEPTGRAATIQGWICEAAAYADDPDSCLYDDFQIIDHTPTPQRVNVNTDYPTVTVTFSDPVDLDSLASNFSFFTTGANGDRIQVNGTWQQSPYVGAWRDDAQARVSAIQPESEPDVACSLSNTVGLASHDFPTLGQYSDPQEYVFRPSALLKSGTRYEVQIKGGEDGVRMRHGNDIYLPGDHHWQFSTLLNMHEQPPKQQDDSLILHVYQPVRGATLVTDKPAMSRLYPDWDQHPDIATDWQPEAFEFELALTPEHTRAYAQRGGVANQGQPGTHLVWLESQSRAFPKPQGERHSEDRRHARHTVNLFGWEPEQDGPSELTVDACPHDPFPYAFSDALASAETPLDYWDHDPGDLTFHYTLAEIGHWKDGDIPVEDMQFIMQTMGLTEKYVPQFFPYRAAQAKSLAYDFALYERFLSAWDDPIMPIKNLKAEFGSSDGDAAIRIKLGAYIRWLQNHLTDHIGPDDIVVVLLPGETFVGGQEGEALSQLQKGLYGGGRLNYRTRAVVVQIPTVRAQVKDDLPSSPDIFAEALLHEFGHTLSLPHLPGDNSPDLNELGHFEPGIEAFRIDPSGLMGWNKSATEGNEQAKEALLSVMWPRVVGSHAVMLTPNQYATVQVNIQRGFR